MAWGGRFGAVRLAPPGTPAPEAPVMRFGVKASISSGGVVGPHRFLAAVVVKRPSTRHVARLIPYLIQVGVVLDDAASRIEVVGEQVLARTMTAGAPDETVRR